MPTRMVRFGLTRAGPSRIELQPYRRADARRTSSRPGRRDSRRSYRSRPLSGQAAHACRSVCAREEPDAHPDAGQRNARAPQQRASDADSRRGGDRQADGLIQPPTARAPRPAGAGEGEGALAAAQHEAPGPAVGRRGRVAGARRCGCARGRATATRNTKPIPHSSAAPPPMQIPEHRRGAARGPAPEPVRRAATDRRVTPPGQRRDAIQRTCAVIDGVSRAARRPHPRVALVRAAGRG